MWYESPLFIAPITLLTGAAVAYFVTWVGSRKQSVELGQKEAIQQAELRALKLQAEIDEHRRAAAEQARLDLLTVAARAAQVQTLDAIGQLAAQQSAMGLVMDKTHELSNSSRTAMEKIEQGLRADLKAAELAAYNATILAAVDLAATKERMVAALAAKDAELADLQRQMNTLALQIVPLPLSASNTPGTSPLPIPVPVVLVDQPVPRG